jgi:hypothetical protein
MTTELRVPVWRDKYARGWPTTVPSMALEPVDAFSRAFGTDAHFAAYAAIDCRATNAGIDSGAISTSMVLFVVDVDAHDVPDVNVWKHEVTPKLRALPGDPFVPWSRGGARAIWRLAEPVAIDGEAARAAWRRFYVDALIRLAAIAGVVADPACSDPTRLYRAPHVVRDGVLQAHGWCCGDPSAIGVLPSLDVDEADRLVAEIALIEASPAWAKVLAPPAMPGPIRLAPISARARQSDAFAAAALRKATENIASAGVGARHLVLAREAFAIGGFVGAGRLDANEVEGALLSALGEDANRDAVRTCRGQIAAGAKAPRGAA